MLKACPRCQELVLDTIGECCKCQKRFAPDRLPPLTRTEASKILMDRQKEKAVLLAANPAAARPRFGWLRYPLRLVGWLTGLVASFLLLHLLVMDPTSDPKLTAAVGGLTLVVGLVASAALARSRPTLARGTGRLAEVERAIGLLEDEIGKLKAAK